MLTQVITILIILTSLILGAIDALADALRCIGTWFDTLRIVLVVTFFFTVLLVVKEWPLISAMLKS